ncbi:MAG: hypothetical protein QXX34_03550 [Candidatus Bathyarchaeia archaeon]
MSIGFPGKRNLNQSLNSPEKALPSPLKSKNAPPKKEANGYYTSTGQFAKCKHCRPGDPCRWHGGQFRVTGRRRSG